MHGIVRRTYGRERAQGRQHSRAPLCESWCQSGAGPGHVLHDIALEPDRERKKEGVERRAVKTLAEEARRGRKHQAPIGWRDDQGLNDGAASLLAHLAVQDQHLDATVGEPRCDRDEVFSPACENEAVPPRPCGSGDVVADNRGAVVILDQPSERCLDMLSLGRLVGCLVDDKAEGSKGRPRKVSWCGVPARNASPSWPEGRLDGMAWPLTRPSDEQGAPARLVRKLRRERGGTRRL